MKHTMLKLHSMENGERYPSAVDVFGLSEGKERWYATMHIDTISDFGLDEESMQRLKDGESIAVKMVAVT